VQCSHLMIEAKYNLLEVFTVDGYRLLTSYF
jgi:hypothetical protein